MGVGRTQGGLKPTLHVVTVGQLAATRCCATCVSSK